MRWNVDFDDQFGHVIDGRRRDAGPDEQLGHHLDEYFHQLVDAAIEVQIGCG